VVVVDTVPEKGNAVAAAERRDVPGQRARRGEHPVGAARRFLEVTPRPRGHARELAVRVVAVVHHEAPAEPRRDAHGVHVGNDDARLARGHAGGAGETAHAREGKGIDQASRHPQVAGAAEPPARDGLDERDRGAPRFGDAFARAQFEMILATLDVRFQVQ
jgi:hypothetical protein